MSGELVIELEGQPVSRRVAPGGFFFGARGRRHAFRNAGNQPARVLILCALSWGLARMLAELQAATARGMPEIGVLVPIAAAKYGVAIEPPAD